LGSNSKLKILGFAGSLRVGSYNKALLRATIDLLPEDVNLEIFEIDGIPLFNQDIEVVIGYMKFARLVTESLHYVHKNLARSQLTLKIP
jgi:NAD(P)H-dependent FMN reductase